FSGASIDHFKEFVKTFPEAKLITLVDNYRSTQIILDASHALLESVMSDQKLVSQSTEAHKVKLMEASTPQGEIAALALDLEDKIKNGLDSNNCAVLVPKNRQVLTTLSLLHDMGIAVKTGEAVSLFDKEDAHAFLRVLKIVDTSDKV